jgi:hypothetical protein
LFKGNIVQAFLRVFCIGRALNKKSIILALLTIFIGLTGCADKADQSTAHSSESPAIDIVSSSQPAAANDEEATAASKTSDLDFSKPGIYEITKNIAYSLDMNDGGKVDIYIKDIINADGDDCTALVVDGTESNAMDIADDNIKAYVIRKDNGNLGVLTCGEGHGDIKYNTYVYGFDGNKAVLKTGSGYETVSLTTQSITLRGTRNVFGTWVISNICELNDDFSMKYSDDGFFTVQNSVYETKYLDTKIDIPVQIFKDNVYTDVTLPAGSRIYPISIGNENNQICFGFKTEDGSTYRLFTDFGEYSYNISGIDEYDIFVDMPYADA